MALYEENMNASILGAQIAKQLQQHGVARVSVKSLNLLFRLGIDQGGQFTPLLNDADKLEIGLKVSGLWGLVSGTMGTNPQNGATTFKGTILPGREQDVENILRAPMFDCGGILNFGLLHINDVGPNPRDCRSEAGALGGGSLQFVRGTGVNRGKIYADVDMFQPYDIYGFGLAGHGVFEVLSWPGRNLLKSHFLSR
jgi:hypothetical protein